jgi:quercetin dioxygenase-like cupin family protein
MKQFEQYSSADFDKTPINPVVNLPDRLAHPNVEDLGAHAAYSAQRKHPVFFVDLPSKCLSMTIGWLDPTQSSNMHRHTYETILYVLEGEGYSTIQGKKIAWKVGDAVYIPVWAWHSHTNTGPGRARYLACENAPLLQNLGGIALREEAARNSEKG